MWRWPWKESKGEFSGESPRTMRHESGQSTYILWAPRPVVHGNAEKQNLAEQCLPLWGRWPSASEVGRGKYRFAELLLYGQRGSALFCPLRGHLPQRGRLKHNSPTIFLSTAGRGALRMCDNCPVFVTHCQRRLAAKGQFTLSTMNQVIL